MFCLLSDGTTLSGGNTSTLKTEDPSGGSRIWPRGGRGAPLPPKGAIGGGSGGPPPEKFEKLGPKCLILGTS